MPDISLDPASLNELAITLASLRDRLRPLDQQTPTDRQVPSDWIVPAPGLHRVHPSRITTGTAEWRRNAAERDALFTTQSMAIRGNAG